jgi:RNA polymerase sigma-70 factor (ECF subfamily)
MEQTASPRLAADYPEQAVDLEDLDAVLRLHRSRVFRFILVSLRDREAAETLSQDCFLKAYQARRQLGPRLCPQPPHPVLASHRGREEFR